MLPRFRLPGAAAAVAAVLLCGPVAHRLLAQSFDRLQSAEIERFLTEAPIVRLGETLGGVTQSRQAVLQLEGISHYAVWKTIDQKRTGVTQLGGAASEINFFDTWKTEVPAYELDKLIGLKMVPAAVARTYRNTEGGADRVGRSRDVRSRAPEEAAGTAGFRGLEPEYGECPAVRQPDLQCRPALQQHLDHQELGHHPDRSLAIVPAA